MNNKDVTFKRKRTNEEMEEGQKINYITPSLCCFCFDLKLASLILAALLISNPSMQPYLFLNLKCTFCLTLFHLIYSNVF